MHYVNCWAKCLPVPAPPQPLLSQQSNGSGTDGRREIMHMDVEEPSVLQRSLRRMGATRSAVTRGCVPSTVVIIAAVMIALSISLTIFFLAGWPKNGVARFAELHDYFVLTGCNFTISKHLKELTKEPHLAGTLEDMATADYVLSAFRTYGLSTHYRDYDVLLAYPLKRSLVLTASDGSDKVLSLTEMFEEVEMGSSNQKVLPAFHAYSPSGKVTADVVYANYGREQDFQKLKELGVNVGGAIAIARYGEQFRGNIVANAAKAGAVALILYSDPKEFADNGQAGYYPFSKWLPPTGIQRGTVFQGVGDPLTPGWPSTSGAERLMDPDVASRLPKIPSLPISAEDAQHILSSLDGPVAPPDWHGSLELHEYRLGRGPGKLNFSYEAIQKVVTIRNVFAVIKGSEEPDRYVLLGNHRDAWTFGAVDPNSGTAALLEVARRFGKLLRRGWQPRRSLILCSWDAEEYGMVGSTEWAEQNMDTLLVKAVAYLNVDTAVAGPGFFAAATPQLDRLLEEITKKVRDPDLPNQTVYDSWVLSNSANKQMITRLGGGGSDFVTFLQRLGIPSVDMYFGKDYPVYHSLYDNYNWMQKFGDPLFLRHTAVSTIWGLAALHLADDFILPFDYTPYGDELESYARAVEQKLDFFSSYQDCTVAPIFSSLKIFRGALTQIARETQVLSQVDERKSMHLSTGARILNDRLILAERGFLDGDGLKGRVWQKHLIYAPARGNNYGFSSFPGIDDTISDAADANNAASWLAVQHEIWRVSRVISRVSLVMYGELT